MASVTGSLIMSLTFGGRGRIKLTVSNLILALSWIESMAFFGWLFNQNLALGASRSGAWMLKHVATLF